MRGAEIKGLRVWFDLNSDGHSSADEVRDLSELGIVAIAARATSQEGIHPMNSNGIRFSDGRVLPTWDWMVKPAGKAQALEPHAP